MSYVFLTRYIDKGDLLRFMIWEEVKHVYPLFEVDENGHIDVKNFSKWVVRMLFEIL